MAYLSSTTNTGTMGLAQSPSTAVPAGVGAGDIVILMVSMDYQVATFAPTAGTDQYGIPTNFVELFETDNTVDGSTSWIGYKRLTGADAGTYQFTAATSTTFNPEWTCHAVAFTGRHASNNPTGTPNVNNVSNASPVSVTATGLTATAGDDLLWFGSLDATGTTAGSWTPPGSFTERHESQLGFAVSSVATRDNVSAGATGSVTGTATGFDNAGWSAFLIAIPAAAGGGTQTITATGIGSAEAFGTTSVQLNINATGIASAGAFGTPSVQLNINTTGIASAEAFGTPSVQLNINANGIPSGEAFGNPTVLVNAIIRPTGIPSAEAFGQPTVIRAGAVGGRNSRKILIHNNDGFFF